MNDDEKTNHLTYHVVWLVYCFGLVLLSFRWIVRVWPYIFHQQTFKTTNIEGTMKRIMRKFYRCIYFRMLNMYIVCISSIGIFNAVLHTFDIWIVGLDIVNKESKKSQYRCTIFVCTYRQFNRHVLIIYELYSVFHVMDWLLIVDKIESLTICNVRNVKQIFDCSLWD